MNRIRNLIMGVALLLVATASVMAQGSSVFTYQGRLLDGGEPANGFYNLEFRLYDALAGGNLVATVPAQNGVPVIDGLLTTEIDFGAAAFDNSNRWLEIEVNGAILAPRQLCSRSPYAIQTRGIFVEEDGDVGIGTLTPGAQLHVVTVGETPILGESNGIGMLGRHTSASGTFPGVWGETDSTSSNANGVRGVVTSVTPGSGSAGVRGINNGTGGLGTGVYGSHDGSGIGTYGFAPTGVGVFGETTSGYAGAFDGPDNDGVVAGLRVRSGAQTMLIDGNEIDSVNSNGLYLNNNSALDVIIATGGGRAFVGRTSPITTAEDFGIQSPAGDSQYGGMYINTDSATGWPFYGYATAGVADAWTWYNGATGDWYVHNAGDRLTVESSGEVGILTTNPGFSLEVAGSAGKPGGGSWSNSSDIRLKKNVADLDGALDMLLQLRGVTFEYIDPEAINELPGTRIGMIAQEVEPVFPDWVGEKEGGYKTLTFRGFEALTVEALRDLRAEKDAEIDALRAENAAMQDRLAQLEAMVQAMVNSK